MVMKQSPEEEPLSEATQLHMAFFLNEILFYLHVEAFQN